MACVEGDAAGGASGEVAGGGEAGSVGGGVVGPGEASAGTANATSSANMVGMSFTSVFMIVGPF
jgi:hypothetical protein